MAVPSEQSESPAGPERSPRPEPLHGLLMELIQAAGLLQPDAGWHGPAVSLSELFAVHELDADGPLAQRDLTERLRLDKSTVSRLVDGLVRKGYVTRERDPANRRLYRLLVTAEGRAAHRGAAAGFHERHAGLLAAMTGDERRALAVGLTGLLRALRAGHDAAPEPEAGH